MNAAAAAATAGPPAADPSPLLGMGVAALEQWAVDHGQAAFRGRQLHDWLYAKGARRLADVSVLPKAFREQLEAGRPREQAAHAEDAHARVAADGRHGVGADAL